MPHAFRPPAPRLLRDAAQPLFAPSGCTPGTTPVRGQPGRWASGRLSTPDRPGSSASESNRRRTRSPSLAARRRPGRQMTYQLVRRHPQLNRRLRRRLLQPEETSVQRLRHVLVCRSVAGDLAAERGHLAFDPASATVQRRQRLARNASTTADVRPRETASSITRPDQVGCPGIQAQIGAEGSAACPAGSAAGHLHVHCPS